MFSWFKFRQPKVGLESTQKSEKPNESPKSIQIRTDPKAQAMLAEYRARFSASPVGVWVDSVDDYFGIGFGGCTGNTSRAVFTNDGNGQCSGRDETVIFVWKSVSDRVIDVRCVERIPPSEGYTYEELEEERQWNRIAYDFVVPKYANVPVIYEATDLTNRSLLDGTVEPFQLSFLNCFCCLGFGPLKFDKNATL